MSLYKRFESEISQAIKSNDATLFEQVLSYCFDLGYSERKLDIATAEHDTKIRGKEYSVKDQKKAEGILTAQVCVVGDILTLGKDKDGKIEDNKRTQVTMIDGLTLMLGEVGSQRLEKLVTMIPNTVSIKRLPNGEYVTFGEYYHF